MFDEAHVIYRYKYLPFSEGALKTLTDSTIKFTCPLEFNDPFDCMPHYNTESIENISKSRPDLLKAVAARKKLSPAKRILEKNKMVARLKAHIDNGSFARKLLSEIGVVSLSKTALSIPMWSHYANFHSGFVLEFRTPIKGRKADVGLGIQRLLPFPVQYSPSRPHINIGVEEPRKFANMALLTKGIDWEYEQEERVIDQERGPGIHSYRRDEILCSVVAGLKIRDKDYATLSSIVSDLGQSTIPGLTLFRTSVVLGEYKLEVRNHPRLAHANPLRM